MAELLFWLLSAIMVAASLGVVFSRQAIESVVWMFAVVLALSGLTALMGAVLVSLLLFLTYAGAIVVFFAFTVMSVGARLPSKHLSRARIIGAAAAVVVLLMALLFPLGMGLGAPVVGASLSGGSMGLGGALWGGYALVSQLLGWLLLWTAVGAVNIIRSSTSQEAQ